MIELDTFEALRKKLRERINQDREVLEEMRREVRPLRSQIRRIQPRSATAISLVGTEGGNTHLRFDPFQVQLVRVVDSSHREYCLDVVTPRASMDELTKKHLSSDGRPLTSLGRMMNFLELSSLSELSPVF